MVMSMLGRRPSADCITMLLSSMKCLIGEDLQCANLQPMVNLSWECFEARRVGWDLAEALVTRSGADDKQI